MRLAKPRWIVKRRLPGSVNFGARSLATSKYGRPITPPCTWFASGSRGDPVDDARCKGCGIKSLKEAEEMLGGIRFQAKFLFMFFTKLIYYSRVVHTTTTVVRSTTTRVVNFTELVESRARGSVPAL
jgi:hypothetical protein